MNTGGVSTWCVILLLFPRGFRSLSLSCPLPGIWITVVLTESLTERFLHHIFIYLFSAIFFCSHFFFLFRTRVFVFHPFIILFYHTSFYPLWCVVYVLHYIKRQHYYFSVFFLFGFIFPLRCFGIIQCDISEGCPARPQPTNSAGIFFIVAAMMCDFFGSWRPPPLPPLVLRLGLVTGIRVGWRYSGESSAT